MFYSKISSANNWEIFNLKKILNLILFKNAIAGVMGKSKDEAPNILVEETLGHLRPSGFSIVPLEKFLYFMDFYSQKDYKNAESYR